MDKNYILFIKGFIVGIGKIIPGVSGSLLAISIGIYDKALNCISVFFTNMKQSIKYLMPLGLGILLAIIFFSNIIFYFINNYYFPIMLLFLGLIISGIPYLLKIIKENKFCEKDTKFIIIIVILFIISFFLRNDLLVLTKTISNYKIIFWFIIGFIDALTMIIPGISGTAILMMLGCYNDVILMYANPLSNIHMLIPFGFGLVITVLLLTKIFNWLFNNCSKSIYLLILILVLISILSLIQNIFSSTYNTFSLIIGIILFIFGYLFSYFIENRHKKY